MAMLDVFKVAGSALTAQSVRLNTTASNLANAESVVGPDGQPYRGKQVVFRTTPMGEGPAQGVRVQEVVESAAPPRLVLRAQQPGRRRERLRGHAQRERGRGDGQHDLRLALLPEQRGSHQHGTKFASEDFDDRTVRKAPVATLSPIGDLSSGDFP